MNIEEIYENHYLTEKARKRRASTVPGSHGVHGQLVCLCG